MLQYDAVVPLSLHETANHLVLLGGLGWFVLSVEPHRGVTQFLMCTGRIFLLLPALTVLLSYLFDCFLFLFNKEHSGVKRKNSKAYTLS